MKGKVASVYDVVLSPRDESTVTANQKELKGQSDVPFKRLSRKTFR